MAEDSDNALLGGGGVLNALAHPVLVDPLNALNRGLTTGWPSVGGAGAAGQGGGGAGVPELDRSRNRAAQSSAATEEPSCQPGDGDGGAPSAQAGYARYRHARSEDEAAHRNKCRSDGAHRAIS